jgi:hypothetical protein
MFYLQEHFLYSIRLSFNEKGNCIISYNRGSAFGKIRGTIGIGKALIKP